MPIHEDIRMIGYFINCTARLYGSKTVDVDAFIDNLITFEDYSGISASRGFAILLQGQAAKRWQGRLTF